MPQLHCYVPDELAQQVQKKAEQSHLSASKYLALLIKKDMDNQWPEDYFDLYGTWQGDELKRPEQGDFEKREALL